MANGLLAAEYAVTAYTRRPSKANSLIAAGASLAGSPRAVVVASDMVFTMVENHSDIRAVVLDAATVSCCWTA
jgi:3-hydroxyisobutyrate dehydrogenase-like beta-hydroxyacid dehydrogenase